MSFDDKLDELAAEVLAPGRTPQQRQAAQDAFDRLVNQGIRDAVGELQAGTAVLEELTAQLQAIIDEVRSEPMPQVLDKANALVAAVNAAAQPPQDG